MDEENENAKLRKKFSFIRDYTIAVAGAGSVSDGGLIASQAINAWKRIEDEIQATIDSYKN
jgi:hypothetical protein